MVKDVTDKKDKRKLLRQAGKPVAKAAKQIAPKLKKGNVHYRYDTPKLIGGLRAPNGKGRRIAEYVKGNLAGSIKVLSLRKAVRSVIGPRINKRGKGHGRFGPGTGKFDGYYAQMLFGSAKAFQRKVMVSALIQKRQEVTNFIGKQMKVKIRQSASKNGINAR